MTTYNASRARELGALLRAARKHRKLSLVAVGKQIRRHHSQISRWERGQGLPDEAVLGQMLLIYEVTPEEGEDLLTLAREAADPNWISPGVGRRLAALIETEKRARRIVNLELVIVPGLCQTEEYARWIMLIAGVTRDQINTRVDLRLRRQDRLTDENAPEYVAIIGEQALRYPPCDRSVMIKQLQKLLTLAELPNVSIHVLPFGCRAPAIESPFVLMELHRGDPMVHQEHYRATTTLTNPRDVGDYQAVVGEILRQVMNTAESIAFIGRLLEEWSRET